MKRTGRWIAVLGLSAMALGMMGTTAARADGRWRIDVQFGPGHYNRDYCPPDYDRDYRYHDRDWDRDHRRDGDRDRDRRGDDHRDRDRDHGRGHDRR